MYNVLIFISVLVILIHQIKLNVGLATSQKRFLRFTLVKVYSISHSIFFNAFSFN